MELDRKNNTLYLTLELLAIFVVLPVVLYWFRKQIAFRVVFLVLLAAAGMSLYLIRSKSFPKENFWRTSKLLHYMRSMALFFVLPAVAIFIWMYFGEENLFFFFPKERFNVWLGVMLLYPALAAYPQEVVFRGFFFHRYGKLFSKPVTLVIVNGICFGWAHLVYGNWVAPVISTLGGFLFAYRYLQSRSLLVVGIEHGLWGNFLFTVGLGWYFYSGSIGR